MPASTKLKDYIEQRKAKAADKIASTTNKNMKNLKVVNGKIIWCIFYVLLSALTNIVFDKILELIFSTKVIFPAPLGPAIITSKGSSSMYKAFLVFLLLFPLQIFLIFHYYFINSKQPHHPKFFRLVKICSYFMFCNHATFFFLNEFIVLPIRCQIIS